MSLEQMLLEQMLLEQMANVIGTNITFSKAAVKMLLFTTVFIITNYVRTKVGRATSKSLYWSTMDIIEKTCID